jgi:hypothetical protein
MEAILHEIGDVLALAMLVPLIIFVIYYWSKSAWRSDPIGIALMFQKASLILLVLDLVVANYSPESWRSAFLILRIVIFGTVLLLITVDVVNLRRIQTGSKRPLFLAWLRKDYSRDSPQGYYDRK